MIKESMLKEKCANCFKVVAPKNRFKIFNFLKKTRKATVSDLVSLTSLRQPTVTFHINRLSDKGFVKKNKVGRNVWCQIHKKCHDCPLFA